VKESPSKRRRDVSVEVLLLSVWWWCEEKMNETFPFFFFFFFGAEERWAVPTFPRLFFLLKEKRVSSFLDYCPEVLCCSSAASFVLAVSLRNAKRDGRCCCAFFYVYGTNRTASNSAAGPHHRLHTASRRFLLASYLLYASSGAACLTVGSVVTPPFRPTAGRGQSRPSLVQQA